MKKLTAVHGAWPFFTAVFLNAFVDLGHKITVQNTIFKLYSEQTQVIWTAVLNSLILLPFILLMSPAGFISDRFARASVMRASAWLSSTLCALIAVSYFMGWFWVAFSATFLMAAQSAIYSPAKYAFIKELFGKGRLGEANGVVSALSIGAILAGTFAFSISFELMFPRGAGSEAEVLRAIAPAGLLLVASSLFELVMIYRLPRHPEFEEPRLGDAATLDLKAFVRGALISNSLQPLIRNRSIRLAVIGLATFWSIGQVLLAAFPAYFKAKTGIDNTIAVQGILACSGIGIAFGSYAAGRVSRDHIELGLLPVGALGVAVCLGYLPSCTTALSASLMMLVVGFMGGIFIVPLNALVQFQSREGELGKTLAANNWVQNVAMFSFLLVTATFAKLNISSGHLLYLIALLAIVGCGYTVYQLPQSFIRFLLAFVLRRHYRVAVQGMKNIPSQRGALLLGNHVSWIDWAIIQLASPRAVRFVMIRNIYEKWYLKWIFDLFGCIPIEQGVRSREALEKIHQLLKKGELVCLFPEGTLSRTGHLVEFRKGYERACEGLSEDIPIIPFYLHGLWGSQFSRASNNLKNNSTFGAKRDLVIAFGDPLPNTTGAEELKQKIFDLSVSSWQEHSQSFASMGRCWVRSARNQGRNFCMADSSGVNLNGVSALSASTAMSFWLKKRCPGKNIGVLLPSSAGGALANMALLQLGKTLVCLNYTTGREALQEALERAEVKEVVTSKQFLTKLKARGIDMEASLENQTLILLEDMKSSMSAATKLNAALLCRILPGFLLTRIISKRVSSEDTACILFSSGSEGTPKGICLSHRNIVANVKQTMSVLNPQANDVIVGNLPFFHAFGLTAAHFLPLLESIPVVYHPDPTDVVGSAKLIARYQATIMFGTSTFLRLYTGNKKVHPLMLRSVRLVVAGAEKLQQQVRADFKEKFNLDIFEGYGATEATPVISVNLPDQLGMQDFTVQLGCRKNSVGMPLPGTRIRIVDPEAWTDLPIGEAGMILIGGVQVMQGYLKDPERSARAIVELDHKRWYVTGDKGYIDSDGFLYIVDRYSRFAKIGGEMLSLGRIEQCISDIAVQNMPDEESADLDFVLVNLPDEKRGEQLVLLSNRELAPMLTSESFASAGLSNLALPSKTFVVDKVPKLASGKMDFGASKKMAQHLLNAAE